MKQNCAHENAYPVNASHPGTASKATELAGQTKPELWPSVMSVKEVLAVL